VSVDSGHAESYNSLGVLEMRKGNVEAARANFGSAARLGEHLHEPLYNGALLAYKMGDFAEAHALVTKALAAAPDFTDAQDLQRTLRASFIQL
jgi:tetratricopeptide repeat protein 8